MGDRRYREDRRGYRSYDDRREMDPYDERMYGDERRGHKTHHHKKTTTYKTNTMSTMWALDETSNRCLSYFLLFVWVIFMIIAWILLVVAVSLPSWVDGTGNFGGADDTVVQTGLFQQCNGDDCFGIALGDANVGAWIAAAIFFALGIVLLLVTIVLAIISACFDSLLVVSKLLMCITNVFVIIGVILVPIGFEQLDEPCPANANQCGLTCDNGGNMGFFTVCGPWNVGTATYVMVVGAALLFISAFFAACIRPAVRRAEK